MAEAETRLRAFAQWVADNAMAEDPVWVARDVLRDYSWAHLISAPKWFRDRAAGETPTDEVIEVEPATSISAEAQVKALRANVTRIIKRFVPIRSCLRCGMFAAYVGDYHMERCWVRDLEEAIGYELPENPNPITCAALPATTTEGEKEDS